MTTLILPWQPLYHHDNPPPPDNGVYNCDQCGRSFCYPFSLILHTKCHKAFFRASSTRSITPHNASSSTSITPHTASSSTSITPHHASSSSSPHHTMLWCDECGRVFAWQFTLRAHIALKHTAHRPHQCGECGVKFTLLSILQVTNLNHTR